MPTVLGFGSVPVQEPAQIPSDYALKVARTGRAVAQASAGGGLTPNAEFRSSVSYEQCSPALTPMPYRVPATDQNTRSSDESSYPRTLAMLHPVTMRKGFVE